MNLNLSRSVAENLVTGEITLNPQELNNLALKEIEKLEDQSFNRSANQIKSLLEKNDNKSLKELLTLSREAFVEIIKDNLKLKEQLPIVVHLNEVALDSKNIVNVDFKAWLCPEFSLPDLNLLRIDSRSARMNPNAVVSEAFKFLYNESKFEIPEFVIQDYIDLFRLLGENKIVTDSFSIDTGLFMGYGGPLNPEGNEQLQELAERYIRSICIVERIDQVLRINPDQQTIKNYEKNILEITKIKLSRPKLVTEDIVFFPNSLKLTVELEEIINYVLNYALRHA